MTTPHWETIYVATLCTALMLVGIWHIVAGPSTERLFRDPKHVRVAGVAFLLAALPCLVWMNRPYFVTLGAILVASGVLRAASPGANIKLQKKTWPRWGHGVIITSFTTVAWLSYQWNWPPH